MKSIHTFDVFAPTDEQEEAMNKKRGGHYRRGKNKEMDYFIECATSLFPNNHYSRFTPIYDTTKEFYQLITSSDTTERAILNWIASNRAWNYLAYYGIITEQDTMTIIISFQSSKSGRLMWLIICS